VEAKGLNDVDGLNGVQGIQGANGSIGPIGPKGDIGVTGPTGQTGGFDPSTILSPVNCSLRISNNVLSTLTIAGSNPMTFRNSNITDITLPTSGTL
jgi:hypothetical protein